MQLLFNYRINNKKYHYPKMKGGKSKLDMAT